jgi:hypothetical protein
MVNEIPASVISRPGSPLVWDFAAKALNNTSCKKEGVFWDGYKIICDDDRKATFSELYILWNKDSITTAPPRPQSPNLLR